MLKRIFILCSLAVMAIASYGQSVKVPEKIDFAGMRLTLNESARKKIQADVNRLRKSPTHFKAYIDKANIYFPIIEEIFREQNFPDDIKYLIIQESAFRADAVSSSKAVGYWQFKKGTAVGVGMRVDHLIDERKNIVSASRGAARYMTQNNAKLNNWVYALTAYNTGLAGVQKYVNKKYLGARKMTITGNTHWYFLKFLAHKIAFQNDVGKTKPKLSLSRYESTAGKTLKAIAKKQKVAIDQLVHYNQWIGPNRKIPAGKVYTVVIPGKGKIIKDDPIVATNGSGQTTSDTKVKPKLPPRVENIPEYDPSNPPVFSIVNGRRVIIASKGDGVRRLAALSGLDKKQFLKYNDIKLHYRPKPGEHFFITKKKKKGLINYHTVKKGETLWGISQKYGMRVNSLRHFNRMKKDEPLKYGRVLWLRRTRPRDQPVKYETKEKKITPKPQTKPKVKEENVAPKQPVVSPKEDKVVPKPAPKKQIVHVVEAGQTLYFISRKYGVSVAEIMKWNNKTDAGVDIGEKIIIKK